MKAAQINQYGDASAVAINRDTAAPKAAAGQVLVEVHAASLNPVDSMIRLGYMQKMAPLTFPATLGTDIAGIVTQVGSGVTGLKVGDRVFGVASLLGGGSGAFAELATAAADRISVVPARLTFLQAASLPLAGVSALQALQEQLKVRRGQKLLIHGSAGGIGSIAVQVASSLGAHIAATVHSDAEAAFVGTLGANEIINTKVKDFSKVIRDYDAVFDTVGGETGRQCFDVLKKGGAIVSMAGQPDAALAQQRGVNASGQMTQVSADRLGRLRALVESGKVKPCVHRVFPLDQIGEAFKTREAGGVLGKIVLEIRKG